MTASGFSYDGPHGRKPGARGACGRGGMTFYEVLKQVLALLQRYKRVSYRALRLQFDLGDKYIDALTHELVFQRVATDEDGQGLV
jgi:hypothetical protein